MSIRKASESGLAKYLKDFVSCSVYQAFRGDIVDHPCVIVSSVVGPDNPFGTGNYEIETSFIVQGSIDEAIPNSTSVIEDICENVNDAIRNLDLPAEASAKENDFTVIGVMSREGPSTEFDSEENITSVVFKINTLTANIDI